MAYRKLVIDYDKIYHSNNNGDFKIIEDAGKTERSRKLVKIKFIKTGTEKIVRYDLAINGAVSDPLYDIYFDTEYDSIYYGKFKIIEYMGRASNTKDKPRKLVKIKFINTGYETVVPLRCAKGGIVRDKLLPLNDKKFVSPENSRYQEMINYLIYNKWRAMMNRCYNVATDSYHDYGAIGVTVCEYWHDFNNFANSIHLLPQYDKFAIQPNNYDLDKDYLQFNVPKSQRIYSPNTCMFLSKVDNSNLAIKERHMLFIYGIKEKRPGVFLVSFNSKGKKLRFGPYTDKLAAANEYNYYYSLYGDYELVPLFNNGLPRYMSHEEAQKYLVKR